jgi:predicted permease
MPGVRAAAFTSALPLVWKGGSSGFYPENQPIRPGLSYDANDRVISAGYFDAMGMRILQGRAFDGRDGMNSPPVAIINRAMARDYWPGQNAIGHRFKFGDPIDKTPWVTIIGIVNNVRQMGLDQPPRPEMYFPYWQSSYNWMVPSELVIRTERDPQQLIGSARRAIWSIDPTQAIANVTTLDNILDREVGEQRIQATLLAAFAALSLLLASVGLYGVMSCLVGQRTREIGLRMALGADGRSIVQWVAGNGMALVGAGIGIGLVAALAATRLMGSLLFEVSATAPATYFEAALVLGVVAFIAAYVPARRATRIDPISALRYE